MPDDMCSPVQAASRSLAAPQEAPAAIKPLPTLQRNALRKIFDRHEFTPEEVAQLGYRRLQQADGIGTKGLAAIGEWLQAHGLELKPPEPTAAAKGGLPKKSRRSLEQAVRLLRTHGFEVVPQSAQGVAPQAEHAD